MNGVRQFAAMAIWLLGIRYIVESKFVKYILIILLASAFHRSALILIPLYFVTKFTPKRYFYSICRPDRNVWKIGTHFFSVVRENILVILFFVTLFIGSSNQIVTLIESVILFISNKIDILSTYSRYVYSSKLIINEETGVGLGFWFKILVNLFLIIISTRIIKEYPRYAAYFYLFFIGALIFNVSYNIQLAGRINGYLIIVRPILLAVTMHYFWKIKKNKVFVVGFCSIYFLLFLAAIYNSSNMCSPFRFSFLSH